MNPHRSQAGFSMVEMMVALVVLAVGMLGIASLYVTSLRSSGTAISRMQAVNLASDLADRIRANRLAGDTYKLGVGQKKDCVGSTDCSSTDMALNDLFLWQLQIDSLLGTDAQGTVTYIKGGANTPDTYTVTVSWNDAGDEDAIASSAAADENPLSYTLTMQMEP